MLLLLLAVVVPSSSEVSEQCKAETQAIAANSGVNKSTIDLLEKYDDRWNDECINKLTNRNCKVKYGNDSLSDTYELVCEAAGGSIFHHELNFVCGPNFAPYSFDLGFIPRCVGTSCNVTDQALGGVLENEYIDEWVDSFDIYACEAQLESGAEASKLLVFAILLVGVCAIHSWF